MQNKKKSEKPFDTQVMLVSAQSAANLLPALDERLRPEHVVLVVTKQMRERAESLSAALGMAIPGLKVETLDAEDGYDLKGLSEQLFERFCQLEGAGRRVALNLTGGTKPMAFAAFVAAEGAGVPGFYLNVETTSVTFLERDDAGKGPLRMSDPQHIDAQPSLKVYLRAYGFKAEKREEFVVTKGLSDFARSLATLDSYRDRVAMLNWLAFEAKKDSNLSVKFSDDGLALSAIVDELDRLGLASVSKGRLRFRDEPSRFFANGGWLEAYVGEEVKKAFPNAEVCTNLHLDLVENHKGQEGLKGANNELDVVFRVSDTLVVVECKTSSLEEKDEKKASEKKADDIIYKLANLSQKYGLRVLPVIVSKDPLSEAALQRAKDNKIRIIKGAELKRVGEMLKQFLKGGIK